MSSKDCDGDGLLERHEGFETHVGSGAWITVHEKLRYVSKTGKKCTMEYYGKAAAVPKDAKLKKGIWYTSAGKKIGKDLWGEFAIVQEIRSNPCGCEEKTLPGFGLEQP
jgi:hypothetical protein